jgi:hypothetical protein
MTELSKYREYLKQIKAEDVAKIVFEDTGE